MMPYPMKWNRPMTMHGKAQWICRVCGASFPTDDAGTAAARAHGKNAHSENSEGREP